MNNDQEQKMGKDTKKDKVPKKKRWKKAGGIAVGVIVLLGIIGSMDDSDYEAIDSAEEVVGKTIDVAEETDAVEPESAEAEAYETVAVTMAAEAEETYPDESPMEDGDDGVPMGAVKGDDFYDYEAEPEDVVYEPYNPYDDLPEDAVIISGDEFRVLEYRPEIDKIEATLLVYSDMYWEWYDSLMELDEDADIFPKSMIYKALLNNESGVTAEPYIFDRDIHSYDVRYADYQGIAIQEICDATGWYNKTALDAEKEMYQRQWDEMQAEKESIEAQEARIAAGWVPDGTSLKDILRRPEDYIGLKIQFGNCWVAETHTDRVLVSFGKMVYGGYDYSETASVILTITDNTNLVDGRLLVDDWFTFNGTIRGVDQFTGRLIVEGGYVDVLPNL